MFKTLLLSLLFSVLLFGQESTEYPFIGVSLSAQSINGNPGPTSWEGSIGLKYGQQSLDWRTIFSLEYTPDAYLSTSVEVDKILLDDMFGTAKIRPYLGMTLGYISYDEKNIAVDIEEKNGLYVGANLGYIIYLSDKVDLDLSYHYYSMYDLKFLDDLHGATLSLHYFF